MNMKQLLICMTLTLLGTSALYAQKNCYVVKTDGSQQKAISIKVRNQNGDLDVTVAKNMPPLQMSRKQYRFAFIPKNNQLEQFEKLAAEAKFNDIVKYAPALYNSYKFLGWGDYIAATECEAFLSLGRDKDARQALNKAKKTPGANRDAVLRAEILCLLKDKEYASINKYLTQLMTSKNDNTAAFAFNMRAKVALAQGQKKQAVLEYLKTLLLFENKKEVRSLRDEAKREAIAIMKELKDPRVSKIEAIE